MWPEYELQVSAYNVALQEMKISSKPAKLAILQIGYRRNKAGYKFTEVEDQFGLFMAARQIWSKECEGQAPSKREYPIVLSPAITVEEALAEKPVQEALPVVATADIGARAPKKK